MNWFFQLIWINLNSFLIFLFLENFIESLILYWNKENLTSFSNYVTKYEIMSTLFSFRVVAGGRKVIRDPTFRMGRKEIFFNFPSRMKKKWIFTYENQAKIVISWEKGRDCSEFLFSHVKREEIFLNFPSRMWEGKRLSFHFPFQRSPWFLLKWNTILFYFVLYAHSNLGRFCLR